MAERRVLIVDDSPSIRKIIRVYTEKKDFLTDEAENGEEAVKMCSSNNYDLVILDLMMPKIDGMQVINILKRKNIDVPIIVASGKISKSKIMELLKLGIKAIIGKPVEKERLYAEIDNIFNQ